MDYWKLATALALGIAFALVGAGAGAFASNYVLATAVDEALYDPTLATLAVAVLAVLALVVLGVGSRRHGENPYW